MESPLYLHPTDSSERVRSFAWQAKITGRQCAEKTWPHIYRINFTCSGTKGAWTEEQESELRFLFEENQRNPETDKGNYKIKSIYNKKIAKIRIYKFIQPLKYFKNPENEFLLALHLHFSKLPLSVN